LWWRDCGYSDIVPVLSQLFLRDELVRLASAEALAAIISAGGDRLRSGLSSSDLTKAVEVLEAFDSKVVI
jgi:hypothetical protein